MQQTLRNLIADGKTKQAIAELRRLTASDSDDNNAVNLLAKMLRKSQARWSLKR